MIFFVTNIFPKTNNFRLSCTHIHKKNKQVLDMQLVRLNRDPDHVHQINANKIPIQN